MIDFAGLSRALLERAHELVPRWLPNGVERNGRWYIGDFDGADGESANVNLRTGQWIDNAAPDDEVGGDLVSLYARVRNLGNREAALELIEQFRWERDFVRDERRREPEQRPAAQTPAPPPDPAEPPPQRAAETAKPGAGERWRSILPVPKHAPEPKRFRFGFVVDKKTGQRLELEAVRVWPYVFEGERLGYVCRFERVNSDGEIVKDTLPLTWCEDTTDDRGAARWHWKQWAAPRPLYVPATVLSGSPADVPVVVVEGEKCAEEGHKLLGHEFDFVSWPGGCKAWPQARWSLLMGRTVYLWPDADAKRARLTAQDREQGVSVDAKPILPLEKQPGYQAMVGIGQQLLADHGCTVYMVGMQPPGNRPDGWDIADAIAEGWDAARVRDYIRAGRSFVGPDQAPRAAAGQAGGSTPPPAGASTEDDGEDPARRWTRFLLTSAKGAITACRENVVTALDGRPDRNVPGIPEVAGLIRFNAFTNNVEKTRAAPWGSAAGDWLEADELMMGDWLVREHWLPSMSRQALEEAVMIVARRHAYHPLRERVLALRGTWDREKRLDRWLERVCLEEDEHEADLQEYLRLAGRFFLMAMVARVLPEVRRGGHVVIGPGCKFDYMLILEGPQGMGKSTFARILGGDYFADTGLDIQHKDSLMNIQGVWVYEWSELESLTKQEVGAVKRFISSCEDRFRATFDRRPAKYPRQVVFIGTTNEAHYLTDTTGNRRFWPLRVTRPLDTDWLRENVEQLLAEALHYVDAGERFYPDRTEQARYFDLQQRERTVESSIEAAIRTYLYDPHQKVQMGDPNGSLVDEIGMTELLGRIGYSVDKQTDAVVKRAGSVLNALGWTTRRLSADDEGRRPRVYVRPKETRGRARASQSTGVTQPQSETEALDAPPF